MVEWELEEVADGQRGGSGVVVVVETSTGCLLAGDSMGRDGRPAEAVGAEAVGAMVTALRSGACADEHLADQLVIYMAMAAGTSRV